MSDQDWPRLRLVALAVGVAAMAAGCGGGGGGGTPPPSAGTPIAAPPPSPPPAPPPPPPPPGQVSNVRWLLTGVDLRHDVFATVSQQTVTASLAMDAPSVPYWFSYAYSSDFARVNYGFRTEDDGMDFRVDVLTPWNIEPGVYTDELRVSICHDQACSNPVTGSPFVLPMRLDVGYHDRPEPGVAALAIDETTVLRYVVRAAAYSAALDAVVTVSAEPAPALRVHDLGSGAVSTVSLLTAPTSLSLSPDGRRAAVGHDAAVSLVALDAGPGEPVRRMALPMAVGPVVLADSGRIVAIEGEVHAHNRVFWIESSDGSTTRLDPEFQIYGPVDVVLHPSGQRLYAANMGVSPDDVHVMELSGEAGSARFVDSRYHGQYPFCGRLQLSRDGSRLYTACGVVLQTQADPALDMQYAGRFALSSRTPLGGDYRARALSVSPDDTRLAVLEQDSLSCDSRILRLNDCYTRVAVYDTTTLARTSLHGLGPYTRGEDRLRQWGRALFHRADGSLLLLAEVRTKDEPTPTWLLHRLR